MNVILLLFMIGIVLLVFEVVVPGAVLGVLGALAMLAGCVLAFAAYGPGGGTVASVTALALLGLTMYLELVLLPRTRFGQRLTLQHSLASQSQPMPADAVAVVGKTAETLTTLAPSGYVLLEERRYEARSRSGLIEKGVPVRVAGVDNFQLIVSKL
jgi:membrane-bound ClpP family serine protease